MRSSRTLLLTARVLAAVVAVAALVHTATLLPRVPAFLAVLPESAHSGIWVLATTVVTAVLASALALFLVVRAGAREEALALALFLAFLALAWGSALRFASVDVTGAGQGTVSVNVGGILGMAAAVAYSLAAASFLRFSALFPVPLGPERLRLMPPGVRWIRRQLLHPMQSWAMGVVVPFVPFASLQVAEWAGVDPGTLIQGSGHDAFVVGLVLIAAWMVVVPFLGLGLGALNLVDGYRTGSLDDRRRLLWILAGIGVAAWMIASPLLVGLLGNVLDVHLAKDVATAAAVLAPLVLVLSLGMAVLYQGALDPELALSRGTVFGALGLLGLLVFAGLENALSNFVQARLELPGVVGSILAGAVAAGVMLPIHGALERVAGRGGEEDGAPVDAPGGPAERVPPAASASAGTVQRASDSPSPHPPSSTPGSSDPDPGRPAPDRSPPA